MVSLKVHFLNIFCCGKGIVLISLKVMESPAQSFEKLYNAVGDGFTLICFSKVSTQPSMVFTIN